MRNEELFSFVVGEDDIGKRVDAFVASRLTDYSRTEIQNFVIRSPLSVARKIKMSDRVKLEEEYEVLIPEKTPIDYRLSTIDSCKIDLSILHEDNDIIVVNKPRGMVMYPGFGHDSGTLVQAVLAHTNLSSIGTEGLRPGVVHRIDKDTSGVVILAKTDAAHRELFKTFQDHKLVRKYIAFVWNVPTWEEATITGNIGRSTRNRQKMSLLREGGKPAKTHVATLNVWPKLNISQLRCTLETGRTHQIRVHLSAHGFPVVCDPLYRSGVSRLGSVKDPFLLEFLKTHHGQMLHAEVLELAHPITGEELKFKARLPGDMEELKNILREGGDPL